MNKKIIITIIAFLLLIPFRLPVSVVLIKLFNFIAQLEGTKLSYDILLANVVVTKLFYNIIFASIMLFNVETGSRLHYNRKSEYYDSIYKVTIERFFYWWSVVIMIILIIYIGFDSYWISELYKSIS